MYQGVRKYHIKHPSHGSVKVANSAGLQTYHELIIPGRTSNSLRRITRGIIMDTFLAIHRASRERNGHLWMLQE